MKKPDIPLRDPEQVREVYAYYRQHIPHRLPLRIAYAAFNAWLGTRIEYAEGAREDLDQVNRDNNPHILVYNHQDRDYMTVGSIQHQLFPERIGRIRTLANDISFNDLRPLAELMGAVPLYRIVDHQDNLESVRKEKLAMTKTTYKELYEFCPDLLRAGYTLSLYPEGGVNEEEPWLYPPRIDRVKNGAAVIAIRAATQDLPVAITPIGHVNGIGNLGKPRRGKVKAHVGRTIFVTPEDNVNSVSYRIRASLQHSVAIAGSSD